MGEKKVMVKFKERKSFANEKSSVKVDVIDVHNRVKNSVACVG